MSAETAKSMQLWPCRARLVVRCGRAVLRTCIRELCAVGLRFGKVREIGLHRCMDLLCDLGLRIGRLQILLHA